MNFTQFINKMDKLSIEQIDTIYKNTKLPVHTIDPTMRVKLIVKTLENCQNEYTKNKTKLEDLNMFNNDYMLNNFIPSKLRQYITHKENVELQNKTNQCETLHDFCLKLCVDIAIN
jgi:hypothetical protein